MCGGKQNYLLIEAIIAVNNFMYSRTFKDFDVNFWILLVKSDSTSEYINCALTDTEKILEMYFVLALGLEPFDENTIMYPLL